VNTRCGVGPNVDGFIEGPTPATVGMVCEEAAVVHFQEQEVVPVCLHLLPGCLGHTSLTVESLNAAITTLTTKDRF
jgi:hypothetical protein